ncbi:GMC oxidoreductase [Piloderma croceum F 1598]|uniref:GMC oxidoreductase n=1 Tax=Piloderma croceum (strain F 1598) TaxID=765440 RepID=A0A0C3BYI8_PILCF|nr:GMC oxidoreductase [Piloderma croceum F 1598]
MAPQDLHDMGALFSKSYQTDPSTSWRINHMTVSLLAQARRGVYSPIDFRKSRRVRPPNRSWSRSIRSYPSGFRKTLQVNPIHGITNAQSNTNINGTAFSWIFYSTPQPNLNNRKLYLPRGMMLGGCTSIDAMMYHRGAPTDFDEWEKLGAKEHPSRFFRSSEKFTPHALYPGLKPEDHGDSGPPGRHPTHIVVIFLSRAWLLSMSDVNTSRGTLGATKIVTFIDAKGRRSSGATAYLNVNLVARKNLTVAIKTLTTRVLLSTDTVPRAIGIEVAKDESSPLLRVSARKEVILSAGSFNTPQILNLSGLGAKEELEKFGIKVVKGLPAVGKNMYDVGVFFISYTARADVAWRWHSGFSDDPKINYKGASSEHVKIEDTTSGFDASDVEISTAPVAYLDHGAIYPGPNCFTVLPILLHPLSVGTVSISSASPFDKPVVDPNYLSHLNDLKILIHANRLCMRIGHAKALESMLDLKAKPTDKKDYFWSGDVDPDTVTDEEIADFIRDNAETIYHPVGTARISIDDKDSVIDPDLKVHGVQGLRVVNASIFPSQISGHPTAALIARRLQ